MIMAAGRRKATAAAKKPAAESCAVPGCKYAAVFDVYLCDEIFGWGSFKERDFTCPRICRFHRATNRDGDGFNRFTNLELATGWSEFEPIKKKRNL
jgi:hypothetical protein